MAGWRKQGVNWVEDPVTPKPAGTTSWKGRSETKLREETEAEAQKYQLKPQKETAALEATRLAAERNKKFDEEKKQAEEEAERIRKEEAEEFEKKAPERAAAKAASISEFEKRRKELAEALARGPQTKIGIQYKEQSETELERRKAKKTPSDAPFSYVPTQKKPKLLPSRATEITEPDLVYKKVEQKEASPSKAETQDVLVSTLDAPAKNTEDVNKNRRKWAAVGLVGVGIAGLGGLIGALLGLLLPEKKEEGEPTTPGILPTPPAPAPKPIPEPEIDEGIVPPTPYPPAEEEDNEYKEEIQKVVEFFSDIEDKFKDALETTSYFDDLFKMEGSITIGESVEKIGIIYRFENELGTPFTPFLVTLLPQDISGYELDTSKLLNRIQDGPAKELLAMMLKPKTSFVFLVKVILLVNTAIRDKAKNSAEKIDFILSEIVKLYSRLLLTPGVSPEPAALFAEMPESVRKVLSQKSIKMYSELLFSFRDADRSVFTEKISQMRQIKDYDRKTSFVLTDIVPLVRRNLSYTEKKLLLHALTRHVSGLPKKDKALDQKIKNLNAMLTGVIEIMAQEGMEQNTINSVQKLISLLKNIKNQPIKTPELEIPDAIFKDTIPLPDVMNVLFAHFAKMQDTAFQGDPDFLFFDFILGKNATRYKLQAIMLRCMAETLRAERVLSAATGELKIRQKNGSTKIINPGKEFNNISKKASEDFIKAQTKLTQAAKQLRDDPKNNLLKKSYDEAAVELDKVSKSLYDNQIEFRRTFAVYYPLTQAEGTPITPWEFFKREVINLKKYSTHVDKLLGDEYAPFSKHFGFKLEDLKK
jgi:hypothetical protein